MVAHAVAHVHMGWLASLRQPELALAWPLAEWQRVVPLARRTRLLARLAEGLSDRGLLDQVPLQPRRHLLADQCLSRWRMLQLRWTLAHVESALAGAPYPTVLLKGTAYLAQGLPIAAGRLPSDLDLLVPRAHLEDAQARLFAADWAEQPMDAHDRKYYHDWSHEVPPMTHPQTQVELDLHHNILPPVAHVPIDAALLLADCVPSGWPHWQVLSPVDQVLHSAAHLFFDADLRDRLRDLVDLDGLLRHFPAQWPGNEFWTVLCARADQLGLQEPLALALHFCQRWLSTPVPAPVVAHGRRVGPGHLQRAWLLPALATAMAPGDTSMLPGWRVSVSARLLQMRYHLRRMPLEMLVPHLWHKWRRAAAPMGGGGSGTA